MKNYWLEKKYDKKHQLILQILLQMPCIMGIAVKEKEKPILKNKDKWWP
jgi:hypothetical protein